MTIPQHIDRNLRAVSQQLAMTGMIDISSPMAQREIVEVSNGLYEDFKKAFILRRLNDKRETCNS